MPTPNRGPDGRFVKAAPEPATSAKSSSPSVAGVVVLVLIGIALVWGAGAVLTYFAR